MGTYLKRVDVQSIFKSVKRKGRARMKCKLCGKEFPYMEYEVWRKYCGNRCRIADR